MKISDIWRWCRCWLAGRDRTGPAALNYDTSEESSVVLLGTAPASSHRSQLPATVDLVQRSEQQLTQFCNTTLQPPTSKWFGWIFVIKVIKNWVWSVSMMDVWSWTYTLMTKTTPLQLVLAVLELTTNTNSLQKVQPPQWRVYVHMHSC